MDFDAGESSDDPAAPDAAPDSVVVGKVLQRFAPSSERPPPEFVCADPTVEVPLLRLLLEVLDTDGRGVAAERADVLLWGAWCEQLASRIERTTSSGWWARQSACWRAAKCRWPCRPRARRPTRG